MAKNTNIEWAHHTFNPWLGCTKVSPACDHCYAEGWAKRSGSVKWGGERRRTTAVNWRQPLKWNTQAEREGRRFRVFCASLADVFDNQVPHEWRDDLWRLIERTPHLDWLLLTKRISNVGNMLPVPFDFDKLYPNVWLGATICNQTEADRDIPKLVQIQARVRFLSIEPMLGSIDLRKWLNPWTCADCNFHGSEHDAGPDGCEKCGDEVAFPAGSGVCKGCGADDQSARPSCPFCGNHRSFERDHGYMFDSGRNLLDWIIAGGESGPGARPMHPEWVRSLAKQCQEAAVPFLMKQWGEWLPVAQMDDEFMNRLYKPIRVARRHENQGALDDSYGRRCIVPQAVQQADGTVLEAMSPMVFQQGRGSMLTFKVGKKVAGRLLDGVEFNEFPTVVRIGATTSN